MLGIMTSAPTPRRCHRDRFTRSGRKPICEVKSVPFLLIIVDDSVDDELIERSFQESYKLG